MARSSEKAWSVCSMNGDVPYNGESVKVIPMSEETQQQETRPVNGKSMYYYIGKA